MIEALLAGRDAVVVWPTDRGKSMCYQLLALHERFTITGTTKVVVVVAPLIALMKDQVDKLNALASERGEARWAAMLHHRNWNPAQEVAVWAEGCPLVYISEKRATAPGTLRELERLHADDRLLAIAIDEAHLISTWGARFRVEYRNLRILRQRLGT